MTATFIRSNVRWNKDLGEFEMRCESCAVKNQGSRYWPLTLEFWTPSTGLLRCRACSLEMKRLREKARGPRRLEERRAYYAANRDVARIKAADYYQRNREQRLQYMVEYHERNRERINEKKRAAHAEKAARRREYNREWMRADRARKKAA